MALQSDEWVVVTTVQGQFEEAQLRSFLEAHGVVTQVRGETLRSTHGLTVDGLGAVEILARKADATEAQALIERAERGELSLPDRPPEDERRA